MDYEKKVSSLERNVGMPSFLWARNFQKVLDMCWKIYTMIGKKELKTVERHAERIEAVVDRLLAKIHPGVWHYVYLKEYPNIFNYTNIGVYLTSVKQFVRLDEDWKGSNH